MYGIIISAFDVLVNYRIDLAEPYFILFWGIPITALVPRTVKRKNNRADFGMAPKKRQTILLILKNDGDIKLCLR